MTGRVMKKANRKKSRKKSDISREEIRKRREWRLIILFIVVIFVLTWFSTVINRRDLNIGVAENFLLIALIDINIILLILVLFLVLRNFVKLVFEKKKKVRAAKLRTKLVLSFAGLTLFPTLIMFLAAMVFFSGSMDKFFNIKVENSLEDALEIATTYYSYSTDRISSNAREIGDEAFESKKLKNSKKKLEKYIDEQRDIRGLGLIKIFSTDMEELASSIGEEIPDGALTHLGSSLFADALEGRPVSTIHNTGYGDVALAIYPITDGEEVKYFVMTADFVPKSLVAKMLEIRAFLEGYKRNKLLKGPIVTSYLLTLAVIALLVVFTATWLGLYIARGITVPLTHLAEVTKKVSEGDLDVYVDFTPRDEIGDLVESFNAMTQELRVQSIRLKRAYNEISQSNMELEQRRRYMEIVLKNVAAGVISVSKDGIVTTVNKSAERMIGIKTKKVLNRPFDEVLRSDHYKLVMGLIEELQASKDGFIQRQVEIHLEDRSLILMANFNNLVDEDGDFMGMVAVFDDITEIMKAQKMAAWREVARRIAHEIKNPLTPIKLSAQRIRKKYLEGLKDDGKVMDECTKTIITQVEELKTLVNEFSLFARMPSARPRPNNLNEIIKETLALYKDTNKGITYLFSENSDLPTMNIDREQIKRLLINLLENSVEAIDGKGEIEIETSFLSHLSIVRLVIADDGRGITPVGKSRLFEPYYSTKENGTGLGLTIVNTIISDHRGYIRVYDNKPRGTKFIIDIPVGNS